MTNSDAAGIPPGDQHAGPEQEGGIGLKQARAGRVRSRVFRRSARTPAVQELLFEF